MKVLPGLILFITYACAFPTAFTNDTADEYMFTSLDLDLGSGTVIDLTAKEPIIFTYTNNLFNRTYVEVSDTSISALSKGENDQETTTFILRDEDQLKEHPEILDDKTNGIIFKDNDYIIYYSAEDDAWLEHEMLKRNNVDYKYLVPFEHKIPVTGCLSSIYGSGGSITRSYSLTMVAKNELNAMFQFQIPIIKINIQYKFGLSTATSATFTDSYTCNIEEEETGQIFIEPFTFEVPPSRRRTLYFNRALSAFTRGPYFEQIQRFRLISEKQPTHYCAVVIDANQLDCGAQLGGTFEFQ